MQTLSTLAQSSEIIININGSKIIGINQSRCCQWHNIPYAKPPIAKLRWQPPELLITQASVLDATLPEKVFIQPCHTSGKTLGKEENLYINIYRPDAAEKKYPILFYIHGGNNQFGGPAEFSPADVACKLNCMIVTLNYRLGALGFNPMTALNRQSNEGRSGNFALLDIHCALRWVHHSIAAFGGDIRNITVAGFSSGGRNVMAMLISPLFTGLFHRAIAFSGGMTTSDKADSEKIFAEHLAPWVIQDGIQTNQAAAESWLLDPSVQPEVEQWLMALPAEKVALAFQDANIQMDKFPHLYRDGHIIPEGGFEHALYHNVPVMLFSGSDEFSLFLRREPYFNAVIAPCNTVDYRLNAQYYYCLRYGSLKYKVFNTIDSAREIKASSGFSSPIYVTIFQYGTENKDNFYNYNPYYSFHGIFLCLWDPSFLHKMINSKPDDIDNTPGHAALEHFFNHLLGSFIATGTPEDSQRKMPVCAWSPENYEQGCSVLVLDSNDKTALVSYTNLPLCDNDIEHMMSNDPTLNKEDKQLMSSSILQGRWWSETRQ